MYVPDSPETVVAFLVIQCALSTTHVWHTFTARALNTRTVLNPDWVSALLKSYVNNKSTLQ